MKKQVLSVIAASLLTGVAIVSVISCTKTDHESISNEKNGVITHFSPANENVEPTIKTFIQRFENYKAGVKSGGEDIKLGEAEWTLEAGVNYEFQSPKEELTDFSTDSTSFNVNVYIGENNEYYIAEEDAMGLYESMIAFTSEALGGKGSELLVLDLEVGQIKNGSAGILVGVTGASGPSGNPMDINSTDWWMAVGNQGKCNGYTGTGDASTRIKQVLNAAQSSADYWTDVTTVYSIYETDCPCTFDECFWIGGWGDCLSPTEMQNWLDKAFCVVDETIPSGYSRIEADFHWTVITGGSYDYTHGFNFIQYGIPHTNGGGGS